MAQAIEVQNVSVKIGSKTLLRNITVDVPKGKITGLLGPSGAGKTTLIRTILGLQKPTKGQISVLGMKPTARKLRASIGYVTQAPSVYADLTVLENMNYFASLLDAGKGDIQRVLQEVELTDFEHQIVSNLSGGQRARVSLGAALLGKPEVLLLDEPTVGLDPVLRQKLWRLFQTLADSGTTMLLSSHVMDEADKCDHLLFIRDGRLLTMGTPAAILTETNATSMEVAFLKLAQRKSE